MFNLKRFLLLGSVGVLLLTGLAYTVHTRAPSTAFAASYCYTVANGRSGPPDYQPAWGGNCTVSKTEHSNSNFVFAIQTIVNAIGQCPVTRDGYFGDLTEAAVKCFQKAFQIPQTGIVDSLTWVTLQSRLLNLEINPHGWDLYTAYGGFVTYVDFRMWDDSGIWYVDEGPVDGSNPHWCRMDTSKPC